MKGKDTAPLLWQQLSAAPMPHDLNRATRELTDLRALSVAASPEQDQLTALLQQASVTKLLTGIFGSSSYLTSLITRAPDRLLDLLTCEPEQKLGQLCDDLLTNLGSCDDFNHAMRDLRRFKSDIALLTALCDLGRVWSVNQVTGQLSKAADAAVRASVQYLFHRAGQKGDWQPADPRQPTHGSGYFVLAMGKHGANELNYSSDIDLIVFYDAARAKLRDGLDLKTFFVRLTRDLVKLLQERTGDGYVFRTDLRLRPDPGATQVAISTDAALSYYENFGQNWERAALIKARTIAGDFEAGDKLLGQLAPYIWRKYLDFAAIHDIHAMKRQIHAFKGFGAIGINGHNIKLGRGGIREIEFFVQSQQLIAGGRQVDLRLPRTLQALSQLCTRGWITRRVQQDLEAAYLFLRHVEHRLQMIADEQTQTLPTSDEDLHQIALFSGFANVKDFSIVLREHLETVQCHYAALFEEDDPIGNNKEASIGTTPASPAPKENPLILGFTGTDDDPATLEALQAMGYRDPARILATVRGWHSGRYAAVRSATARERLTQLQPHLIKALGRTFEPDRAVIAFDEFLARLPTGIQLFAMLKANPSLLRLVADIMGSAPRLARILSRRHRVLDAVLDPGFFGTVPSRDELSRLVKGDLASAQDFQDILDRARIIGKEQAFLIGVRVLSHSIDAGAAGAVYAGLAERLIDQLLHHVTTQMITAHGRVPGGQAVVIAMGKLGGREMTAGSDLDLILVYDYEPGATQSDGARPLSPNHYYARLTQRLVAALSSPTPQGKLYEVDLRLRPSGNAGPVATRRSSFIDYQTHQAWTWEHMALTRARIIAGPKDLTDKVEIVIQGVLARTRERDKIAADVHEMRERIAASKGTKDIWNLKQVRGGIVDLEFITQFLLLIHGAKHPDVLDQNTHVALQQLTRVGILTPQQGDQLLAAADLFNRLTQVLRLCLDEPFKPDKAPDGLKDLLCRAGEVPDFSRLEAMLRQALVDVQRQYTDILT